MYQNFGSRRLIRFSFSGIKKWQRVHSESWEHSSKNVGHPYKANSRCRYYLMKTKPVSFTTKLSTNIKLNKNLARENFAPQLTANASEINEQ